MTNASRILVTGIGIALWFIAAGSMHGEESTEEAAGGATTVADQSPNAFGFPVANMPTERRASFFVGNSFFNQNWIAAPASPAARDGLGPLFNARSCSACHFKDGRSQPPEDGGIFSTTILRVSLPSDDAKGAPNAHPVYGGQIQGRALPGVKGEADVRVSYKSVEGTFADGEKYALRSPVYRLENLAYGEIPSNLLMSARVAPAMIGLGLLEAVKESDLQAMADPDDRDQDGISGRVNSVWNAKSDSMSAGRFGWKAEQPSVFQQVSGALLEDMGLTTSLFRSENHTEGEAACKDLPSGGDPEVSDKILHDLVYYSRSLAVPAARDQSDSVVSRGKGIFSAIQCAKCHQPTLTTGEMPESPEVSGQTIHPYSDLLLHDMGEELSDGRRVFQAEGREWRTPPLWGVGLIPTVNRHSFLLHDGRARNVSEAILWHGGEAKPSREAFRTLSRADREALIKFVESL